MIEAATAVKYGVNVAARLGNGRAARFDIDTNPTDVAVALS